MERVNMDFVGGNGKYTGPVANKLAAQGKFDWNQLRPFYDENTNQVYVSVYTGVDKVTGKRGDVKNPNCYKNVSVNTNGLQTYGTLRRDEWKALDEALLMVSRYRLGGIQDLIDANLTYNLGNAMGTTVLEWHDVSNAAEAVISMDGVTRGRNDTVNYQYNYLPIPIIHVDYEINERELSASRNLGNPLDTTMVERAARRINEKLESMLFTGNNSFSFGQLDERNRNTIYGYLNFPDRNLYTVPTDWATLDLSVSTNPPKLIADVTNMKQKSINAFHYGPWRLYLPTAYETVLDQDYNPIYPGVTIRDRILKIDGINGIKIIDTLPQGNILLVQQTPDVVRLIRGLGLQNVAWQEEGKMLTKYKVLTIQVPQIRSDQNGKCGIVHGATATANTTQIVTD